MTRTPLTVLILFLSIAGSAQNLPAGDSATTIHPMPRVHDPSTVVRWKGKYYVYTTGRGVPFLSSPDLVNWTREGTVFARLPDSLHDAVPKNDGMDAWAPDIVRVGDQFYLYYAVSSWGSFVSAIGLATNSTLDPKDPGYLWTDRGVVVASNGKDDMNAIDPGVMLAPDGTLWMSYGSYHGSIKVVELDPRTGLVLAKHGRDVAVATAHESEASDLIFHEGYYYLFVNHGSCCKGRDSTYNIRVGRSRSEVGPYVDRAGVPLTKGLGELFLGTHDHRIGPGHFGLLLDDGVEKFSLHYEADTENQGRSTLGVRPLLWSSDGWPVAGDILAAGVYQIAVRGSTSAFGVGKEGLSVSPYMAVDAQRWTIAPADGGFYRIAQVGTGSALEVGSDGNAVDLAGFTGADTQLWDVDEFPDRSWRIRNKASGLVLGAGGKLGPFNGDAAHPWWILTP